MASIVFSHGNGFPASTYRVLNKDLESRGFQVSAIEKLGHNPQFPVTSNWPRLRDQLIDFIDAEAPQGAYLVGHSLGGLLSLLAACKRPDLAQGLVMLDSPVFTGWRALPRPDSATGAAALVHVVPLLVRTFPDVPGATN